MRVNPVNFNSMAYSPKNLKSNNTNNNNNVSFKRIDPDFRDEILEALPLSDDEETRTCQIVWMDYCYGFTVRYGGKNNPKGEVYVDVDPEHHKDSVVGYEYRAMMSDRPPENAKDTLYYRRYVPSSDQHLENPEVFKQFIGAANWIASKEFEDGSPKDTRTPQQIMIDNEYEKIMRQIKTGEFVGDLGEGTIERYIDEHPWLLT